MIWCIETYIIAYVKKIGFSIHYVKSTAQLLFKIRFPKGGPTCRSQVVNQRHNTVKHVCNDRLYNNIYYLWFIQ